VGADDVLTVPQAALREKARQKDKRGKEQKMGEEK